jgi:hypothetical protein
VVQEGQDDMDPREEQKKTGENAGENAGKKARENARGDAEEENVGEGNEGRDRDGEE